MGNTKEDIWILVVSRIFSAITAGLILSSMILPMFKTSGGNPPTTPSLFGTQSNDCFGKCSSKMCNREDTKYPECSTIKAFLCIAAILYLSVCITLIPIPIGVVDKFKETIAKYYLPITVIGFVLLMVAFLVLLGSKKILKTDETLVGASNKSNNAVVLLDGFHTFWASLISSFIALVLTGILCTPSQVV